MNHLRSLSIFSLLMAILLLSACSNQLPNRRSHTTIDTRTLVSNLQDTDWELTSWTQADKTSRTFKTANGEPLTLSFNLQNKQPSISGYAGCNRFFGTYEIKQGKLSIPPAIGATRMACSTGMDTEQQFLDALGQIQDSFMDLSRRPSRLLLILSNGDELVFTQKINPFAGMQKLDQRFLYISHQQVPCPANAQRMCLQYRESEDQNWQVLPQETIYGFEPEPNNEYRLRLDQYLPPNTPKGSQVLPTLVLDMVIMVKNITL